MLKSPLQTLKGDEGEEGEWGVDVAWNGHNDRCSETTPNCNSLGTRGDGKPGVHVYGWPWDHDATESMKQRDLAMQLQGEATQLLRLSASRTSDARLRRRLLAASSRSAERFEGPSSREASRSSMDMTHNRRAALVWSACAIAYLNVSAASATRALLVVAPPAAEEGGKRGAAERAVSEGLQALFDDYFIPAEELGDWTGEVCVIVVGGYGVLLHPRRGAPVAPLNRTPIR